MLKVLGACALLIPLTASGQVPQTQRYCGSGDKSLDCYLQNYREDNLKKQAENKEYLEQNRIKQEQFDAAEAEKRRLRTIQDSGCNPRVQRCK
jgi:hypothetical protein